MEHDLTFCQQIWNENNMQVWQNMALFRKSKQYEVSVNAKWVACMYIWNITFYSNNSMMCAL